MSDTITDNEEQEKVEKNKENPSADEKKARVEGGFEKDKLKTDMIKLASSKTSKRAKKAR